MHYRHHRAETLLEVIISLGVLMITLGYSGSLIASTTSQIASNQNHIIASNLAKEGIEVVRNIIGTNLFRLKSDIENCWNAGFVSGAQITHVEDCIPANKIGGGGSSSGPSLNTSYYFRLFFDPLDGRFSLESVPDLTDLDSLSKDSISSDTIYCEDLTTIPCIYSGSTDVALSSFAIQLALQDPADPNSTQVYRAFSTPDSTLSSPRFFRVIEIKYHDMTADGIGDVMEVISHVFLRQSGEFREVRFGTLITPFEI